LAGGGTISLLSAGFVATAVLVVALAGGLPVVTGAVCACAKPPKAIKVRLIRVNFETGPVENKDMPLTLAIPTSIVHGTKVQL